MKEENLKSKQSKLLEELEHAKHVVEECKRLLGDKRKQVRALMFLKFFLQSYSLIIGRVLEI